MSMPHLLSARNINKHYGAVAALKNTRFDLDPGEVHALTGENGAGKSTLARILAGSVPADSGEIRMNGELVSIRHPLDAQRLGIGIIGQELDFFPHLTVGENLVIGNLQFSERSLVSRSAIDAFCRPFLETVELAVDVRACVESLSIGQQQLLAVARALSMKCRVVLMDEPTSTLSEHAARRLFDVIATLKNQGVSVVYVSHKMDEIFRLCDRITVMRDGETIATRDTAMTNRSDLIAMMVGRPLGLSARPPRRSSERALLSVKELSTRKLKDVSFVLHRGEVLGIGGLVGAGRSELGEALFGMDRVLKGSIRFTDEPFAPRNPAHAQRRGFALLPEDRKHQGLMPQMSVRENGTLSILARISRFGFLRNVEERRLWDSTSSRLSLKCASPGVAVSTLSGGNQQKALLGRLLLSDPEVLFLDDPARGIDVGAKEDIYLLIDELAESGKGIILVSSELPELLRCSDRILVLKNGQVAGIYPACEATQEMIMAAATHDRLAEAG
jgi:ribose transport system ATP-binding protein